MRSKIAVLASGNGSNLQAILDYFAAQGNARIADIAVVISNRISAYALERARQAGVITAVIAADDVRALSALLDTHEVDLVVLAGYLKRIPKEIVAKFPRRIVNIHPAPLPRFGGRGMYGERVHAAVLEAGIEETCVTVHFVDEHYDRGDIFVQYPVPVHRDDTPDSLARRVLEVEHVIYPRAIDLILRLLPSNALQTS